MVKDNERENVSPRPTTTWFRLRLKDVIQGQTEERERKGKGDAHPLNHSESSYAVQSRRQWRDLNVMVMGKRKD
jgi:hypothetical protein